MLRLKDAFRSFLGEFIGGMAKKLWAYSLEALVTGNFAAAGLAAAGAVALGVVANKLGGEGAPVSGGGGYGGGYGQAGGGTNYTTIFVGDGFLGESNRRREARLRRYVPATEGSYAG